MFKPSAILSCLCYLFFGDLVAITNDYATVNEDVQFQHSLDSQLDGSVTKLSRQHFQNDSINQSDTASLQM